MAQSIWSLAALSGVAMGPVFITVIGQYMESRDINAAETYFHQLLKTTILISVVWNAFILAITPLILNCYELAQQTRHLVMLLVLLHNIFNALVFPFSGALGNGLRAAGDVRFTMFASIFTTVCVRLVLSWVFAVALNMGVMGIAWAMCAEWTAKGLLQYLRLRRGKWKEFEVI